MYTNERLFNFLAAVAVSMGVLISLFFTAPLHAHAAQQCTTESQCVGGYVDSCFPLYIWIPFFGEYYVGDVCQSTWDPCLSRQQVQVCTEIPGPVAGGWYGSNAFDGPNPPPEWGCEKIEYSASGQGICFGGYFPEPTPQPPTPTPPPETPPPIVTFTQNCSGTNMCGEPVTGTIGADGSCNLDLSCTPPQPPTCANGASNYPTCTFPPQTCANGATNFPTCTFPQTPTTPTTPTTPSTPTTPATPSAPSGGDGGDPTPNNCGSAVINDCSVGSASHGSSANGSCTNGTSGECRYTCVDGSWSTVHNTCSALPATPPDIAASPRIVEMGQTTTLAVTTNGHTGCIVTGGSTTHSIAGAGESFTVTIRANTTFTVNCTGGGSDSVTVELVPKTFET